MLVKVKLVIASHLSDAQEMIGIEGYQNKLEMHHKLNFAKFLLFKYPDTNVEIDADNEWSEYEEKYVTAS